MKMSFVRNDVVHAPEAPAQVEVRTATPRSFPIGRVALLVVGLLVIFAGVYWLLTRGAIYSYGVVATGVEVFHAPVRSRVVSVHAEPGDRVVADTVLCVLVSDDGQTELKEAQEILGQQRGILETVKAQEQATFADPAVEMRDLETAGSRVRELGRHILSASRSHAASRVQAQGEVDRWSRQVTHSRSLLSERDRRLAATRTLLAAGAALPAEVDAEVLAAGAARFDLAEAEAQLASAVAAQEAERQRQEDELASLDEALALGRTHQEGLSSLYQRARIELERERGRGLENIQSRIAGLEARVANLRKLAGPTEVRALADGVVTEVFVTNGSNVPKDAELLTLSGTGKLWINAFVPPDRASELRLQAPVMVYPTTGVAALRGKVTAGGGIEYKVHAALRDRITDPSAIYVRIDLDVAKPDLIPGNVVRVVIR